MANQTIQLLLNLKAGPETDTEELAELTQKLWEELAELDVETVDFVETGEVPIKAKSGDSFTWGALLLTLAASGGVLTTIINVLQAWLARHDEHSLTLEIEGDKLHVTGISSEEQQRLINAWLTRHQDIVISND